MKNQSSATDHLLRKYVHGYRLVTLTKAAGLAAAIFLTVALTATLLDRLFAFPRSVRLSVLSLDALAMAIILARPCAALLRRIDPVQAAIAIESRAPIFDQRLVTVVSQSTGAISGGTLLQQLRREVESVADQPGAHPRVALAPLIRPWIAASTLLLLIALLWPWPRLGMPQLLSRFFHPLADIAPATATRLHVQPGDVAVIAGRTLTIIATVQSQPPEQATLHLSDDGRTWTTSPMNQPPASFTLPAVDHDWRYFVTAGDATSPIYSVRSLHSPAVAEYRIHCQPPAYLRIPVTNVISTDGHIDAPQGSQLTVDIVCTEAMRLIMLGSATGQMRTQPTADPAVRQAHFSVSSRESFSVDLTAENGLTAAGPRLMIRPIIDRPPVVRIISPENLSQHSPLEPITMRYVAGDDHGLTQLTLEIRCTGAPMESMTIPIAGDSRDAQGIQKITFRTHHPIVGDVVTLRLQAKDVAGQSSSSDAHHLLICPRSTAFSPDTIDELTQVATAATAADRFASELDSAAAAFEQAKMDRAGNSLCDARETGPKLENILFERLANAARANQTEAIENLVDLVAMCRVTIEEVIKAESDPLVGRALLARTQTERHQLRDSLRLMKDGWSAAAILADRAGLAAFNQRDLPRGEGAAERLLQIRQQAGNQLDRAIRALGLDPQSANIDDQLQAGAQAAEQILATLKKVDFPPESPTDAADRSILAARLLAAAIAQTLRFDGDPIRAAELATRSAQLTEKPGLPSAVLLAFRANAAAIRYEDTEVDALDTERRRSLPKSDQETLITKLTAIARTLHADQITLENAFPANPDLAVLASAISDASCRQLHDAAVARLVAVGALPSTFAQPAHLHTNEPAPRSAVVSETPTYEDQLRAYFQALDRSANSTH